MQGEKGKFHSLINPGRLVSEEAVAIHGIDDSKLVNQPPFNAIAAQLADFIRGTNLHAHNASFDISFLDMEFKRSEQQVTIGKLVHKVTDTLIVARQLYPGRNNSLDAIAERLGLDLATRRPQHNAMIDAELLADVYFLMIQSQATLDLEAGGLVTTGDVIVPGDIVIHTIARSSQIQECHQQFLVEMQRRTGVQPLAMEAQGDGE